MTFPEIRAQPIPDYEKRAELAGAYGALIAEGRLVGEALTAFHGESPEIRAGAERFAAGCERRDAA